MYREFLFVAGPSAAERAAGRSLCSCDGFRLTATSPGIIETIAFTVDWSALNDIEICSIVWEMTHLNRLVYEFPIRLIFR